MSRLTDNVNNEEETFCAPYASRSARAPVDMLDRSVGELRMLWMLWFNLMCRFPAIMTYWKCMLPVGTCLSTRTDTRPPVARAALAGWISTRVSYETYPTPLMTRFHVMMMMKTFFDKQRWMTMWLMSVFAILFNKDSNALVFMVLQVSFPFSTLQTGEITSFRFCFPYTLPTLWSA